MAPSITEQEIEKIAREKLWINYFATQDCGALIPLLPNIKYLYAFFLTSPAGMALISKYVVEKWTVLANLDGINGLQGGTGPSYYVCFTSKQASQIPYFVTSGGKSTIGDICESLYTRPLEVLGVLGIALSLVAYIHTKAPYDSERVLTAVRVRFLDLPSRHCYGMSELMANSVGRFVSIQGHVIKAGAARPLICRAKFICSRCGYDALWTTFDDGIYAPPEECGHVTTTMVHGELKKTTCRNTFLSEFDRHIVDTTDYQRIKLQEDIGSSASSEADSTRTPRVFEVEVRGSLVNCCIPGDYIKVL